jgi:hypothetical protein
MLQCNFPKVDIRGDHDVQALYTDILPRKFYFRFPLVSGGLPSQSQPPARDQE